MVLFDRPLIHNRFSWNLDRKLLKCKTLQRVGCFIEVEWMSIGKPVIRVDIMRIDV